jgi:RNA polymerase sigma-70 factor (ECF subfamily)
LRDRPDEASDEALMAAWQHGDAASFDALVERYRARLFGFLLRTTAQPQQAEDAYSETLLLLVRHRDRYDPAQRFQNWLFTIARNCAATQRRSWFRRVRLAERLGVERAAAEASGDSATALVPEGELRVQDSQQRQRVEAALRQLPEEHRAVLLLFYREDMQSPQIAQVLGLSDRQVRDRLAYARRRMRELLGQET